MRFFDTASIYGQGESERILGAALGGRRKQTSIVTKAGQYFPAWMSVARPFKSFLAPLIRKSSIGSSAVSKLRAGQLPQDFSDRFLRASIEASLRRLNTDYLDVVLLHSPSADIIRTGEALGCLGHIRDAGKTIKIGISCEDLQSGSLALDDPRVEVLELPLWPMTEATTRLLDRARLQAVVVVGRGLMSAAMSTSPIDRWSAARTELVASLRQPEISRVLIGTTQLAHLNQVLDAVERQDALCL
jgi:aryl-alcohol dehydrogenase-like predicted oxidoreductase